MLFLGFTCPNNTHGKRELPCSKKNVLKELAAMFNSLSPRAVSQGVSSTAALNNRKFSFLKYSILTLPFTQPMSLKTLNCSRISWLQPRLPPVLTSLISYFVLESNRPSRTSLLVRIKNCSWLPPRFSWTAYSLLCHIFSRCNPSVVHFVPPCVNNSN